VSQGGTRYGGAYHTREFLFFALHLSCYSSLLILLSISLIFFLVFNFNLYLSFLFLFFIFIYNLNPSSQTFLLFFLIFFLIISLIYFSHLYLFFLLLSTDLAPPHTCALSITERADTRRNRRYVQHWTVQYKHVYSTDANFLTFTILISYKQFAGSI
jgi:hypothetical protein